MASDIATAIEDDSRRKHRRSPDEEAEESSKRRKHRHHHRSRHHRHHRKSKKHGDDKNDEEEVHPREGGAAADAMVLAPSSLDRVSADLKPDDDMEEGEIVDYADGQIEPADKNLVVDAKGVSSYTESDQEVGHITNRPLEINERESGEISKIIEEQPSNAEFHSISLPEKKEGIKFRIGKSKDGSSPKTSIREPYKIHANGDFSWDSSKKCNTLTRSYENGSGNEKADSRKRSLSHDSVDNKPRSKSTDKQVVLREHSHASMDADREEWENTKLHSGVIGVGKYDTSSNRLAARSPNGKKREADGDRGSEQERDRSMDKDKRRDRGGERNRFREKDTQRRTRGGDREKREADRDQDSEKEPDGSMYTDMRKGRETGRDREKEIQRRSRGGDGGRRAVDWDQSDEKEQERARDRDRETSRDRKRDTESKSREKEQGNGRDMVKERDRSKERHISREHIREKERGRSNENDIDLDRRKVNERDRRNRDMVTDSDTQRESRRDRSRDRVREKEQDRERGRDRERDFSRAREKDSERDKNRGKYREDRDSYTNYRYGETEDHQDRTRRNNPEKLHNSKIDSVKEAEENGRREEDEQEDYQERISLQLADREEEDIEKIKEESRRIRQAILEKYKCKQIQQQTTPPSSASKDEAIVDKTDQPASDDIAAPAGNRVDNTYVGDSSFSVGKSPPQNELSNPERTSAAGGLGEGTPKSEMSDDMFCDDIFGDSPAGVRKMAKGEGLPAEKSGIHDNWDDADGYYSKPKKKQRRSRGIDLSKISSRRGELPMGAKKLQQGQSIFNNSIEVTNLKGSCYGGGASLSGIDATKQNSSDFLTVGSQTEVLSQDSGVRGCWFKALIIKKHKTKVKVRYLDLKDAENEANTVEEWILSSKVATFDQLGTRVPVRTIIRPVPQLNKGRVSWAVDTGSAVDVWWHDGWWEGLVIQKESDDKFRVYLPGEKQESVFGRGDLRISQEWVENRWIHVKDRLDLVTKIMSKQDVKQADRKSIGGIKIRLKAMCNGSQKLTKTKESCNEKKIKTCPDLLKDELFTQLKWGSRKRRFSSLNDNDLNKVDCKKTNRSPEVIDPRAYGKFIMPSSLKSDAENCKYLGDTRFISSAVPPVTSMVLSR